MSYSETTFDVRIWGIDIYKGKRKTTYWVRWKVAKLPPFKEPFTHVGLAKSFRSDLQSAASKGEAFRLSDGLPVSMVRIANSVSWYEAVVQYVDMKWPKAAATYRQTIAASLTPATAVMLDEESGRPREALIRSTLNNWVLNSNRREQADKPEDIEATLRWIKRNAPPLANVLEPDVARKLHDAVVSKRDGKPLARSVARQRRMILNNFLNYCGERGWLSRNPVAAIKWTAPKPSRAIDRRRVANPIQARTLLREIKGTKRSGPRLYACYAAMYFAALRPEEAINLNVKNLKLPEPSWDDEHEKWVHDWGEIFVEEATPHAGSAWTDSGKPRDRRGLKHREQGEGRPVPCPPELTAILREHVSKFGTGPAGELFVGVSGKEVPAITWHRVWRSARKATFTESVAASPLVGRPYDLRHAAVSTWLNAGIDPTDVAEWAGHSVEVLMQVYAKCVDGRDRVSRAKIQRALGHGRGEDFGTASAQ
ncbi:tyrosine-type recombinase/integrase [Amycolatopsis sp. NPDC059090]|uniref:tyrosine-type recombinase/integrase n=1 Tax=unclassified Amycolatopsis TaxID=2618356 RepID=UPI0036731553